MEQELRDWADLLIPDHLPPLLRDAVVFQDLESGETLYHRGDPAQFVYVLQTGRIRMLRYTIEGKIVTFRVVHPQESFSITDLHSDLHQCDAISEVRSRVAVYPKALILKVLHNQTGLTHSLIKQLNQIISSLKTRLELREVRSACDRVLQYLDTIIPDNETTVAFDHPLKWIADEIGLSPEVFYRTLARLEKEGFIQRQRRRITLSSRLSA